MSARSREAPRPVESAPGYGDVEDALAALARLDLFRDLTEEELDRIAAVASLERIPQDRVVPRAQADDRAFYFVVKGKVAFAEFSPGTVPRGPVNPKKRATPLMQVAKKNVALFDVGDFFANDHVERVKSDDGVKNEAALYTCVPVVLLKLPRKAMDEILASVPKIREAIDVRAEESYYRQSFLKLEGRGEVFDFYLKEGFEYAQAIKIIQTDKCIDCDECVKACEDRHGIARIERFGPQIGLVQFTLNCRTCEDARCITPCNFDAIGYDDRAQEVIVYDNCVGCTLCAKACPHEAIRMVDIVQSEQEGEKARPGTVVAEGEKASKKKKPKRIANKCDHCLGYEDMACISACPTGAIIQIDPRALFRRDGGYIERAERYFDPAPFEQGYSHVARTQGDTLMRILFALAGALVLACTWEYFARKLEPELSLWRWLIGVIEGPAVAKSLVLEYTAVSGMGRWMGYIGAVMMIGSALYTLRLHVPGIRGIGSSKTWFDFHVVFGLAGPMLALLHTDLDIFQWYWVAWLWWAVFIVVITGLVGRFLYTAIPRAELATEKDKRTLDRGIQEVADQWSSLTQSANIIQHFLKAQDKQEQVVPKESSMGLLGLMVYLVVSETRRIRAGYALRFGALGGMKNARLRKTAIKLMARRAAVERRTQILGVARRLLARWRAFHIAVSIVMLLMLIAHSAISIWALGL